MLDVQKKGLDPRSLQLQVGFWWLGILEPTICRGLSAQRDLLDKSRPLSP